jgi:hypothetical protein
MKADGSTSGGCWIYTGVYADGVNQAARQRPGSEQSGSHRNGAGPGPPIDASSTTGHRRIPMADRGVTGRRMSGGTNRVADGPGPMSRTSRSPSRLRTAPSRALAASTASLVTIRSSCKPTARRGCSHFWSSRRAAACALRTERVAGAKPRLSPAGKSRTTSPGPPSGAAGRTGRGRRGPGGHFVHRGAAVRYRHAHLARKLPPAAIRVRGVGCRLVRRSRPDLRSSGRCRPRAVDGGRRRDRRRGRTLRDGTVPGPIFHAGQQSADDPKYTVAPQRQRIQEPGRRAVAHWRRGCLAARGKDPYWTRRSGRGGQPSQSRTVDCVGRGPPRRIDLYSIQTGRHDGALPAATSERQRRNSPRPNAVSAERGAAAASGPLSRTWNSRPTTAGRSTNLAPWASDIPGYLFLGGRCGQTGAAPHRRQIPRGHDRSTGTLFRTEFGTT